MNLDSILKSRDSTLPTKVHLVKAIVFPIVMCGCESWTVKKAKRQRIDAVEMWFWRRLLRVPWTARRSNQSILEEISLGCSLEGLMLKLKLRLFCHLMWRSYSFFFLIFKLFLFIYLFFLLYNIVLVLPYINMHPPRMYTSSQSWTPLPHPSLYHSSGSSQWTSPKLPVSCIELGLAIRFLDDIIHVLMPLDNPVCKKWLCWKDPDTGKDWRW